MGDEFKNEPDSDRLLMVHISRRMEVDFHG
jgi:hypothetical protein